MQFQVIRPVPRQLWDELSANDGNALATQSHAWIEAISRTQSYQDASRAYEFHDGQTVVLPLVRRRVVIRELASLPDEWGFGGALSRRPLEPSVLRAVLDDLRKSPCMRIYLRPNPLTASIWDSSIPEPFSPSRDSAHILDLRAGFGDVWSKKFTEKTRNQIRKAERSGLEIACDCTGAFMPIFFDLYRQSAARWATQGSKLISLRAASRTLARNPLRKFIFIADTLGSSCQTWLARHKRQPAAAIIVLRSAHHAQYIFGAMNKDLAGPTNANDLLHRAAIEDACNAGITTYHMGSSGGTKSLIHFKSRFGAQEVSFSSYRLERPLLGALTRLRRRITCALMSPSRRAGRR